MADSLEISISVDTEELERRLGAVAGERLKEALTMGLAEAGHEAAGEVRMATEEAGLEIRTGALMRNITSWPGSHELQVLVGVPEQSTSARYAYLLIDVVKTIVPKGHKYLAIPIGSNLEGTETARLSSPHQLGDEAVFRGLTVGIMIGDMYEPYFALARSVTVAGRNVLGPAVERAHPEMIETVQKRVDKLLEE